MESDKTLLLDCRRRRVCAGEGLQACCDGCRVKLVRLSLLIQVTMVVIKFDW